MLFTVSLKYAIKLDSKSRLVLPLEIRKIINVKKNDIVTLSTIRLEDASLILSVSKQASDSSASYTVYSKNMKYIDNRLEDENND